MNKLLVFAVGIIGVLFMISCDSDESLPLYKNGNLTDTTGINEVRDLFVSGEIDQVPFEFFNGVNGYSNWSISTIQAPCGPSLERYLQVHTTAFIIPELRKSGVYIDIMGCLATDSLSSITALDSIFVVGNYEYFPKQEQNRAAAIRYIDADSNLWSTSFGPNSASFSEFTLSALVDNSSDEYSKKIAFGRFDGYLYSPSGDDSLRLKIGQFKGRIVQ